MSRSRRLRPTVEPLGTKVLPSSLGWLGPIGNLIEDATDESRPTISGRLQGAAQARPDSPDAGAALDVAGAGRVGTLGPVQFTGSLRGVGSSRPGRAAGQLTLSDERGSITLRLRGPAQRRLARLPHRFRFVVQDQTGATRGLRGNVGTLRVTPGPESGTVDLALRSDGGRD